MLHRLPTWLSVAMGLLASCLSNAAHADAPECQVRVLAPVTDDLGNRWHAGQSLPVDIERDDPNGGSFCAHGGSCVPRRSGGVRAVSLQGCAIGPRIDAEDRRLVPRRSPN